MWSGGGLQLDLKGLFTRFVDLGVTSQSFWQDGGGGREGGAVDFMEPLTQFSDQIMQIS